MNLKAKSSIDVSQAHKITYNKPKDEDNHDVLKVIKGTLKEKRNSQSNTA